MKNTAYDFWKRVDDLNESTLISLAESTGIKYQRIKAQRSADKFPTLTDTCLIAEYLNTSVEFLTKGVDSSNLCPEALAVQENMELRSLIRYIQADSNLLSALQLVIKSAKVDTEKVAN